MSDVLSGDEWKQQKIVFRGGKQLTRMEKQAEADREYGMGNLSKMEWSRLTDELSDVTKWTAEGKIKHKTLKEAKATK
jgi:hypothetical protein